MDGVEGVEDAVRDNSEIFVCIKTPQDFQKVSVYRTSTVKQVCCETLVVYTILQPAGRRCGGAAAANFRDLATA